ncbi:predicted protein [Thalassiosira pseudonana CCMP1335]|uniref:Uncharacterized protein n=1 Tax=Thalassiosira pseudonana TaxID=35128 RepID=B8C308_THAPS|nr:predicted protein [Thalassiosira pseudonana CCMP1335]EED92043.1 predicted protein [Thalassiosira pseudonana CCMP1335]
MMNANNSSNNANNSVDMNSLVGAFAQQHGNNPNIQQMQQLLQNGGQYMAQNNNNNNNDNSKNNNNNGYAQRQQMNQQMQQQMRRLSAQSMSSHGTIENEHLLKLLDRDIDASNQQQGLNNVSQQQQQLMMAMMSQQQQQHNFQQQPQMQMQPSNQLGQQHVTMQPPPPQQQQQQPNVAQLLQLTPQQQQIHEFLQRHGHNLTQQQRTTLQQQLANMQGPMQNSNGGVVQQEQQHMQQGLGLQQQHQQSVMNAQMMGQMSAQNTPHTSRQNTPHGSSVPPPGEVSNNNNGGGGGAPVAMDDLLSRQREQLRHLQSMLKSHNPGGEDNGTNGGGGGNQQQLSTAVMEQMIRQRHQQMQSMQTVVAGLQGGMGAAPQVHLQQQQQQPQPQAMAPPQNQVMELPSLIPQQNLSSEAPESLSMSQPQSSQVPRTSPKITPSGKPPNVQSVAAAAVATVTPTRVVPVSLSPRFSPSAQSGGVSEAALIYTKHALDSIILSLNANNSSGRVYTIRDLSTCLGAWDLNVPNSPSCASKRQKMDEPNPTSADLGDGNADTAFHFYHERSCPILLDAKRQTAGNALPLSVDDFGDEGVAPEGDIPTVTGAVVLTFGADKKFTGGIGEEGVLTKAIVEFFYDPSVSLKGGDHDEDALVEAEEQIFARVDGEHSALIKAALHALSPSLASAEENNEVSYIPTIWSGNTHRVYQYCLLGNFDDTGKERASKRLCVAIQKRTSIGESGETGPAKGVCRITLTLSPASVLAKKKQMAAEHEGENSNQSSSAIHRKIRQCLRILRPPKLVTRSNYNEPENFANHKRKRMALRRPSVSHLIDPTLIVVGMRCKHELLLDTDEIGKVYVNGCLVVDCSLSLKPKTKTQTNDTTAMGTVGSDALPAHTLFGIDFTFGANRSNSFSFELPNRDVLEREYGALLMDALIDAGQGECDVAGKLLSRLITGNCEEVVDDDEDDNDSNSDPEPPRKKSVVHSRSSSKSSFGDDSFGPDASSSSKIKFDDISRPCLESIVLSCPVADSVGIGAKALGTKFRMLHGKEAYPCEMGTSDEYRLRKILGVQKVARTVPRRARDVLLRGGYLNLDGMAKFMWVGDGSSWDGDHDASMVASDAMEGAIDLLRKSGCKDVKPNQIRFVTSKRLDPAAQLNCWYDTSSRSYYVNDSVLYAENVDEVAAEESANAIVSTSGGEAEGTEPVDAGDAETEDTANADVRSANNTTDDTVDNVMKENNKATTNDTGVSHKTNDNGKQEVEEEKEENETSVGRVGKVEGADADELATGAESQEKGDDKGTSERAVKEESVAFDEKEDLDKKEGEEQRPEGKSAELLGVARVKEDSSDSNQQPRKFVSSSTAAFLLGFYIAKEHPDPTVLDRFVKCNRSS